MLTHPFDVAGSTSCGSDARRGGTIGGGMASQGHEREIERIHVIFQIEDFRETRAGELVLLPDVLRAAGWPAGS